MSFRGSSRFISEHTAEYILVPQVCRSLRRQFAHVVALYFWANLEGGRMAKRVGPQDQVQVASVFARSPKQIEGSTNLLVRIDSGLIERSRLSEQYGIPVYAGLPLVGSFMDLDKDPKCLWFSAIRLQQGDVECALSGEVVTESAKSASVSNIVLHEDIAFRARPQDWVEAVKALHSIRQRYDSSPWPNKYKPFHVLAWND